MSELGHNGSAGASDRVLVVVPCLNEEEYLGDVLDQLLADADRIKMRIVVADGGSTDNTRAIVRDFAVRDSRVTLLENSKKIQSAGVNRAVEKFGSKAEFLIRVDAHARYPDQYCQRLLDVQAKTQADSVVVSMHTAGKSCFQRAAAAAQNSILGNGGAVHRNIANDGWVDHGHHALMTIKAFTTVGGYDDSFSHVEDVELDIRLKDSGFKIYLTGEVAVSYYPRRTIIALFCQYRNVGRGRARNFLKHRKNAKVRHLALAAVVPALCLLALTSLSVFFAVPALAWALLCIGYGILLGVRLHDACAAGSGIAAMATQAGWSFGFFRGLIVELWLRRTKMSPDITNDATIRNRS